MRILKGSRYKIAGRILNFIKRFGYIFNDKYAKNIPGLRPNYANTNTVESIFGKYRLFFKGIRRLYNSSYNRALFEILRLKHNLNGPYTGRHKGVSPKRRLGVNTKFGSMVDALVPN